MKNEIQDNQTTETMNFPYGWNKGDTCVMITNKAKKSTCEYIVESYDGKYFGVRSHTGLYHRVSPWRMFHTGGCNRIIDKPGIWQDVASVKREK